MFIDSTGNVGIGTLPSYQLDLGGSGTGINTGSLRFNGTTFDQSLYLSITQGAASASKALVLDSSSNISGINNLSATSITGTIQTAAQPNISSIGSLATLTVNAIQNANLANSVLINANANTWGIQVANGTVRCGLATNGWIGTQSNHNTVIATNNTARMTISSSGNITVADTISGLQLDLGSTGTGLNVPNLTFRGTTFPDTYYTGITLGSASPSKALVLNSTLDLSGINNLSISGAFIASTSMASPTLTVDTINTSAGLNINYTNLNLNGAALTSTAAKLNYNDITTLGAFQVSKTMTLDSSGVGLMPLGTSSTNCLRFYGNTANRETMNIYRVSDTNGLVIASRTTSTSNNKTYPVLNLISTDNPSSFVGGVSATSADLFNINWNDKPSVGFTSQTHRFCFNVGNSQPYKSGFPHTYTLATSADAFV